MYPLISIARCQRDPTEKRALEKRLPGVLHQKSASRKGNRSRETRWRERAPDGGGEKKDLRVNLPRKKKATTLLQKPREVKASRKREQTAGKKTFIRSCKSLGRRPKYEEGKTKGHVRPWKRSARYLGDLLLGSRKLDAKIHSPTTRTSATG